MQPLLILSILCYSMGAYGDDDTFPSPGIYNTETSMYEESLHRRPNIRDGEAQMPRTYKNRDGEERILYDFYVSYSCSCYSCSCGKGCTTSCCSTCYTYYTYCTTGRYNPNGYTVHTSTCTECPPGYYCAGSAVTSPVACDPGTYSANYASSSCTSCPDGTFSETGWSACLFLPSPAPSTPPSPAPATPSTPPSPAPSPQPSDLPSATLSTPPSPVPFPQPSGLPSATPTGLPSAVPTLPPTPLPSGIPTGLPSGLPTLPPTILPSPVPTQIPTPLPTQVPTAPTSLPTSLPTIAPTTCDDVSPYCQLVTSFCATSFCPTCPQAHKCDVSCHFADCAKPTPLPSPLPTFSPSDSPTILPTYTPSPRPSSLPTLIPTHTPTSTPTSEPTPRPTLYPTSLPTVPPTHVPSPSPSHLPTMNCIGVDPAQYLLTLSDTGGDGWGGVAISVLKASDSTVIYSTTLVSGGSRRRWVCLSTDCYRITLNATDVEISWQLEDHLHISVSGVAPTFDTVCTNNTAFANTPTLLPTLSLLPSHAPTPLPTAIPIPAPTSLPTPVPTHSPTFPPSPYPTPLPTSAPTENCMDGQYLSGTECIDCEAGRYVTVSMAASGFKFPSECTMCEVGYYSRVGADSCILCPEGKYSNYKRTDCVQCYSGQYVNTTEQGCFNCSAGKYAPVALNDYCIECGAGAATGQDETASSCDSCSPGTYAVGNGEVNVCLDCPAGTYSESRASICTDCEVGTYAAVNRSSTCIDCDAGKSTLSQTNALHCVDCSVGQYSNGRASTCSLCPVGHYADKSGTAQCIGCEAGSYSNATGVSQCEYCLNGTYQETSSQSSCVSCEVGKHAPYLNSKYCFKCADGHTSVQGAAQCEQCDPGYFWAYSKGANRWACESCPFGATCGGGKDQPVAQQGFWIDRLAASRDPSLVRNVYPCARDTCSKLSVSSRRRMASSNCLLLSNFSSPSCADDALFCAAGSKGPLCGSCEEGWNFNAESRVCAPCGETTTWTQAFASLAICLVVFAFLYSLRNGTLFIPKPMRWLTKGRTKIKIKFINVLLHINRAALKLMVSTYQIVMSAGSNLELTFPEPYTTFSMWMGFVQLNFFSLDCLKSTYYISVYTTCAFPIIFVGLNWVVFFIRRAIYLVTRNDDNDDEEEEDKAAIISETNANNNNDNEDDGEDDDDEYLISLRNQHINISLMVVFVVLPPVAKKQFRALDCVVLEDGSSYLRDDTGIDCLSDGYRRFSLINGCLIAIYQSIPLAYIFLLCRVRHKLSPLIGENESTQEALARRDTDKDLDAIRFLFNDTKIDRWYFEVLELYRRIIFTAVLPLLSKDSAIIAYIGCLMGLVSVIYFRELLPFRTDFTNLIAVVCQYVILIVFLCALMIETNSRELFKFTDFSFGLFLIGINVIILVLVVYGGLLRYRDAQHIAQSIKELEIESAVDFTSEEFADAISSLQLTVPKTHILAYYYTSLKEAEAIMLDKGIPAIKLHDALTTHTTHRPPLIITEELDENKTTPNQEESVLIGDRGGVVLSLKAPHELAAGDPAFNFMNSHATSREAVFCLSLPRSLLWCVQGKETEENKKKKQTRRQSPLIKGTSLDGLPVTPQNESHTKHLRLLPVEILEALGNPAVVHHHHHHHHHGGHRGASHAPQRRGHSPQHSVKTAQRHPSSIPQFGTQKSAIELKRSEVEMFKLNTRLVLSAYQLKGFDDIDETLKFDSIELQDCLCIKPKPIINGLINMTRAIKLHRCSYSEEYTALLKAARSACDKLRLVPVYCYTSTTVFENLAARGVRLSGMSQSESGVYFTLLSPCALGFGTDSFEVTLLEHLYGSAAVSYFEHKGLADVVLVYGAEPYCIEGYKSSNRVRFGLDHFREFRSVNDHFHLRKDRIITAIQLADTAHQHHKDVEEFDFEMADINREIQLDAQYHTILNQVELEAKHNIMVNNPNNTNFDLEVMSDEYEEKSLGDKWLFKSASTTDFIDKKPHHGRSSHDNMSVSFEMV